MGQLNLEHVVLRPAHMDFFIVPNLFLNMQKSSWESSWFFCIQELSVLIIEYNYSSVKNIKWIIKSVMENFQLIITDS